jgi:hypothetical protein
VARVAGELRAKKPRRKEQTDNVDQLAKAYLRYFTAGPAGDAAIKNKATPAAKQRAAMKRWFE